WGGTRDGWGFRLQPPARRHDKTTPDAANRSRIIASPRDSAGDGPTTPVERLSKRRSAGSTRGARSDAVRLDDGCALRLAGTRLALEDSVKPAQTALL